MNTAHSAAIVAPPPPPAIRGLISGALIAGLAALFLIAAPSAEAQTARTYTFTASVNGGPACFDCRANEGDTLTITWTVSGFANFIVLVTAPQVSFGGTAIPNNDYRGHGAQWLELVSSGADSRTKSRDYAIVDDNIAEPDETITFAVPMLTVDGSDDTYTTTSPDITITIAANDQPVFNITANDADTTEGGTAVFTITLGDTAPASGAVSVDWAVSGGVTSGDYTVSGADTDGTLSFTALGSQTLNFAITADGLREDAETLTVTLSNPSSGSVIGTASATTTIAESDQPTARTLTVTGPSTLTETDGNLETGNYTIALSGTAFPSATTVTWTVTNGTTADADFVAATDRTGTVSFATTDTSQTFTLTLAGDDLNEAAETFSVQVSVADAAADGGTAYGPAATTTITDDDPITATLHTATVTANEGGNADFIVDLTGGTATADVVITYNNADATGTLTIPTGTTRGTLTLTVTDDMLSEDQEMLSLSLSDFTATSAGVVTVAGSATLTINADSADDITVTIAAPSAPAATGQAAEFTVAMNRASAAAVTVAYSVTLTVDMVDLSGRVTATPASPLTIAAGARSGVISVTVPADVNVAAMGALTVTLTPGGVSVATGGGTADLGTPATATVDVTSDDPAAREARLEAPLASAGSGVGQLAAQAVVGRLAAVGGGGNELTIAGRNIAGAEVLAAEVLAGGYATGDSGFSTAELLRRSGFNLAAGDGGRGFNFWGSGEYVSAEGDHDGVDYDGDTSAFTVGIDTGWRDGLVGVAVSRSDGDVDFTVTADGMKSTLETEVTSVHPYLTRRFNRSQLWLTAGHGNGDAELKEKNPDAVIKTDITVTTAAFGITHARGDLFTAGISALYSRAKLDEATGDGRNLPATTADTLRIKAESEIGWSLGAWSPFVSFALRHDSGDGDTGGAADLGGGVEWRTPTVLVRLAGSGHIQGQAADEQRASLTVRKSSGNFDLGLNLGMDNAGLDTARLLTGEWRF